MPRVNSTLKAADPWLKWLIIAGTVIYFVEITTGISTDSVGHSVFWWIQSFIAFASPSNTSFVGSMTPKIITDGIIHIQRWG